MGWSEAVRAARRLSDALAAEAERAQAERRPIRELNADGIVARTAERAAFQEEARGLERALAAAIAPLDRALAPPDYTEAVAAVRRDAAALREIDRVNRELAGGALAWIKGYLAAVRPPPTGYDRRGLAPGTAAHAATVSRRA